MHPGPLDLGNDAADICVPDDTDLGAALERTTHLAIGAHQDDLEIMACAPIADCFGDDASWFAGVVATTGAGSPRAGAFADVDDAELADIRRREQRAAARTGRYGAMLQLGYESETLKRGRTSDLVVDLVRILRATRPTHLYTHDLADTHPTHVAVATATLHAARRLGDILDLDTFAGCEVWRSLDWLPAHARVELDSTGHDELAAALIGAFESQIAGGKRYDLAATGRRRANATYADRAATDSAEQITLGMDLRPLLDDPDADPVEYVCALADELRSRIRAGLAPFFGTG